MIDPVLASQLAQRLGDATSLPPPRDGQRRAAVAVVLHGSRLLLMKRTERASDPWSGHVSLPGGRHELEDPHLLATAIRETKEELGIELTQTRLLGSLPVLHPNNAGPNGIEVTPFVFVSTQLLDAQPSAEAQAVFWLPLDEVASGRLDGSFLHPGSAVSFPSWQYQGYTVWGLTMRIVRELLDRMQRAG